MIGKIIIGAIFVGILYSLGSALVHMVRDKGNTDKTVRALTLRIGLSVGLFLLLFVLYGLGIIEPHGIRP